MIAILLVFFLPVTAVAAAVVRGSVRALHELRVWRMHTAYYRYLNALAAAERRR